MTLDVDLFICEVEKRPALYNVTLKEYSDRNLKQKLWTELHEQFVENWHHLSKTEKAEKGKDLQSKWKNLRTCFKREYDAQKKMPSGTAAKKRRKYIYFDQLLFLCNSVESRETSSNLSSPSNSNNHTDTELPETVQPETEVRPEIIQPEIPVRASRSNIAKKRSSKSYEDSLLDILRAKKEEENEIDEDKYFLLSLLPTFRKFNEDQKFIARTEIMDVLMRVRLSTNAPILNSPFALNLLNMPPRASSAPVSQCPSFAPAQVSQYSHTCTSTPSPSNQDIYSPGTQEPLEGTSEASSLYSLQQL